MKNKKIVIGIIIAIILITCAGCGTNRMDHSHNYTASVTAPSCTEKGYTTYTCACGDSYIDDEAEATGHTAASISAVSNLENPVAAMTVQAGDISVTGICGVCGESFAVTEGIGLENAVLGLGDNTITVKCGELSATLTINVGAGNTVLDAIVSDDAYVSSDNKDNEYTDRNELGTNSSSFRAYFRVNISDILSNDLFTANKDNARVQLTLAITSGKVTDDTTVTLKAYAPAAGVTDIPFSNLTWNSIDNKKEPVGEYSQLHWHNGTVLVSGGAGYNVSADDGHITITLGYSQIADFVDENGNILLAFATNTEGLKVGSLENKNEANRPVVKVILSDEHFHVFDQEVAEGKYLVSANCKEKAKYHKSCACGEAGTETFMYGNVIDHTYGELIPQKDATCTEDGMKAHYRCTVCGKYFLEKNGVKKLVSAKDLKISAGHDYKLIPQKDATCTTDGNNKYFKCADCGKYFDADKKETTKEAQTIAALGHTYSELIPQVDATCTTDGMKEHYRCTVCQKYFVEKDGQKVATSVGSLKIPAGHTYKLVHKQQAPTCTKQGWNKLYKCGDCSKYFDADKNETTKDVQRIPALDHTEETIPGKAATCTEPGLTDGKKCTVCNKTTVA